MDENLNLALFDMDGSLADFAGQLKEDMIKLASPEEVIKHQVDVWDCPKLAHLEERERLIKSSLGWWRNLPVLEDGMKIFKLAAEIGFHNQVLTKGPVRYSSAWKEKLEWCFDNLNCQDVTITHDKSNVYGKVLYDDYP